MMICRQLVVSVVFIGALMVRRRRPDWVRGGQVPVDFVSFDPAAWDGSSDYQRWVAWDAARTLWAEANLPNSSADLTDRQSRVASLPDQPWDEIAGDL